MSNEVLDKLIWSLIYAGLLVLGLGLSVGRSHAGLGWLIGVAGVTAAVAGGALIAFRARRKDET